jgi:hypothetical protein
MKKLISLGLPLVFISTLIFSNVSLASVDSGKIDFYKVFSNNEVNINRIGNSIHGWSIYLPNDAVINKDSKSANFDMTSSSYKMDVYVNVLKNVHNYTLGELYANSSYLIQNNSYQSYDSTYTCSSEIKKDKNNKQYISLTSISPGPSVYTTSENLDEQGTFNEQRIYLGNGKTSDYIYVVNLSMDLPFYKLHQSMFLKIADSFETKFDTSNPNIKDLSEQVNTYRMFESKVYGWKVELAPYWKSQGADTSMNQLFKPLYSYDELSSKSQESNSEGGTENTSSDSAKISRLLFARMASLETVVYLE